MFGKHTEPISEKTEILTGKPVPSLQPIDTYTADPNACGDTYTER